jgi:hypothetical protein
MVGGVKQGDMRVEIKPVNLTHLSPGDRQSINKVLIKSPNATVFHTVEWNEILIDEFGLQNVTLLATRGETPVGLYTFYVDSFVCQSSVTSLESVYGGPISVGDDRAVVELLREAERLHRIAWFDVWTPANYDISPFLEMGYQSREMYTSILGLDRSEEELWAGLKGTARAKIRKALKNHVDIVEGDLSLADKYYDMVISTFAKARINILPRSFYRQVVERLGTAGMARLLLAKHSGKFIAGAIFLCYKDTVYYWHGASHREYLNVAPNDLILWELIKWARQEGYEYYDLVRVEPDRLPGIASFKMKFGGDIVPCYYLAKRTLGHRLWRLVEYAKSPTKLFARLRQAMGALSRSETG